MSYDVVMLVIHHSLMLIVVDVFGKNILAEGLKDMFVVIRVCMHNCDENSDRCDVMK